ncbi:MAG TPA: DUF5335 family protein [Bryobacteraceae bacterium]|nr:DUF5335 family protein [Bryobacteraceae bacterium]
MQEREIPASRWRDFFDTFSMQHKDWIATIEIGERVEARELPLVGVSADSKGSEPNAIEIEVGRDPSDQLTHIIDEAERVTFRQSEDEAQLELEIEAADGEKTAVRLRRATRAEIQGRAGRERTERAAG